MRVDAVPNRRVTREPATLRAEPIGTLARRLDARERVETAPAAADPSPPAAGADCAAAGDAGAGEAVPTLCACGTPAAVPAGVAVPGAMAPVPPGDPHTSQ
jgi:hypothetical protein